MRICPTYLRFLVIDDFDVMQNFKIIFIYSPLKQQRTREKDKPEVLPDSHRSMFVNFR